MEKKAAIDFLNKFTSKASEARHKALKETGLKVLSSKQMLQRLSIALSQIKAVNN